GTEYSYSEYPVGEVSAFSSYGYAFDGSSRPDVVAPGCILLSPYNNYATSATNTLALSLANNDRNEQWGAYWGTSMASPCVAGIIATWLEANPLLDPEEAKSILKATAVSDVNTGKHPLQSGAGKVDGYAGLLRVLESGGLSVPESSLGAHAYCSGGTLNVIAPNGVQSVDVVITAINGATVLRRRFASADSLSPIAIDVANLARGVYVVAITCDQDNSTSFIKLSL
ncbi:MAG: S8 family peptidase, partial [Muribaculaceae bacterium]